MKRKTNLFYTSGDDSNFLTFSNYTESLTGNFLATDYKIYPSKFLCIKIPKLEEEGNYEGTDYTQKEAFIKLFLAGYYENKLAFLRDYFVNSNKSLEENIFSLGYLIETILKYDDTSTIEYVNDVTEQNFNGIYSDTICIINGDGKQSYTLEKDDSNIVNTAINYGDNLYGWYSDEDYIGPDSYKDVSSMSDGIIDDTNVYYSGTIYTSIVESSKDKGENIEFNVVIPLFNVTNMNPTTNTQDINEKEALITINDKDTCSLIDVPLGIWFSDSMVILKRDESSSYVPNWSLMLSSQFKPFPYSKPENMPNEISTNNYEYFDTYSQILTRQNAMIDKFNTILVSISNLSNEISTLKQQVTNLATTYEISNIKTEMLNFETNINNIVSKYISTADSNRLKWNSAK